MIYLLVQPDVRQFLIVKGNISPMSHDVKKVGFPRWSAFRKRRNVVMIPGSQQGRESTQLRQQLFYDTVGFQIRCHMATRYVYIFCFKLKTVTPHP